MTIPIQAPNEQLKQWKESAMSVWPDMQEIGKLLNVPIGQSVHDKIIPAIKELQKQTLKAHQSSSETSPNS